MNYLYWTLIHGAVFLALYLYREDLRGKMLFTGLILSVFGLAQPLFVPGYWDPQVIHKFFGLFDLESVVDLFFLMGIAASLYETVFDLRLEKNEDHYTNYLRTSIKYTVLFVVAPVFILYISLFTQLSLLRSLFVLGLALIVYLYFQRPRLLQRSLVSGLVMMFFYMATLWLMEGLTGFVSSAWNPEGALFYLLEVPIEEYIYGFFLGIMGCAFYPSVKNYRIVSRDSG